MPERLCYSIDALDTWLFREGRPFSQQDAGLTEAVSMFPPTPRTMAMGLRAALARNAGWRDADGPWKEGAPGMPGHGDKLDGLTFRGPYIAQSSTDHIGSAMLVFPAPANLARRKRDDALCLAAPVEQPAFETSLGALLPLAFPNVEPAEAPPPFVNWQGLQTFLQGRTPRPERCVERAALVAKEASVGIARHADRRVAREGMLYQAARLRPAQSGRTTLVCEVRAPPGQDYAALAVSAFGGDARASRFRLIDLDLDAALEGLCHPPDGNGRYAVVLLTPALITGDGPDSFGAQLPGELVAIAMSRMRGMGGHSSVRSVTHLPPHRLILAAGTVLFMHARSDSALVVQLEAARKQGLGEDRALGFGEFVYGLWPQTEGIA